MELKFAEFIKLNGAWLALILSVSVAYLVWLWWETP